MQQIRTGQPTASKARIVLDLASGTSHSVEAYETPPHVTISIAGTPTAEAPAAAPATSPAAPGSVPPSVLLERR